jgi:homoserine O-acetyltransferase
MDHPAPPQEEHDHVLFSDGLTLECGRHLPELAVAYRSYGTLNPARSNAVLICHALTGDQYVADRHPLTGRPGWWEVLVGPGRVIDTDRYFVLCANVIGGSMGGMQVLEWASTFPNAVFAAAPVATASYHSAQNIAFHEVGRQAIFADPHWYAGEYAAHNEIPARGLAVARMAAHITYVSEQALTRKFGRRLRAASDREPEAVSLFGDMFEVESYLHHQGSTFVRRFDANSYLTITRAMDYFDLAAEHDDDLALAFAHTRTRFCVVSFSSDWLFPTSQSRAIARALNRAAANVSFVEITTDKGHDAFLLDEPDFHATLRGFLRGCEEHLERERG